MKKILFILGMTTCLGACVQHRDDPKFVDEMEIQNTETVFVAPENIIIQPDEERTALQKMPETPQFTKADTGPYMDWLAKKLRKELRSSGVQVKEVSGQIDLIIPNKVAFGSNQSKIQNGFQDTMLAIANLLKEYDETMIQVIGYTDNFGAVLTNKEASLKKAELIADFLKGQGILPDRIITDGAGADNPLANNATPAGRELNRRVEITIISLK